MVEEIGLWTFLTWAAAVVGLALIGSAIFVSSPAHRHAVSAPVKWGLVGAGMLLLTPLCVIIVASLAREL